eukprot:SAG25_NODE_206_length_11883_cov_5.639511_2_plen_389_part_00
MGQQSCSAGYEDFRCAACSEGYYRASGACLECPPGWPLWLLVALAFGACLLFGLLVDWLFSRIAHLSERVAPMLILLTFLQTVALLLDVPLSWPQVLVDFINMLSIFNLNLDLAKPECALGKWDFKRKQIITLLSPLLFFIFVATFVGVLILKISVMHLLKKIKWQEQFKSVFQSVKKVSDATGRSAARSRWQGVRTAVQIMTLGSKIKKKTKTMCSKANSILTTAFVVASVFFMRTMVAGLDCSENDDGKMCKLLNCSEPCVNSMCVMISLLLDAVDLDAEPQTECDTADEYYAAIQRNSWIGLTIYILLWLCLIVSMAYGGASKFEFLAEKMKPQWYFWELVLLVRKLAVMVIALRTSEQPEQGWFLCSGECHKAFLAVQSNVPRM